MARQGLLMWHYRAGRLIQADGSSYYVVIEWYKGGWYMEGKRMSAGWTGAIKPGGDTKQELIEDLEMMLADVKRHKAFTLKEDVEEAQEVQLEMQKSGESTTLRKLAQAAHKEEKEKV